MSLNDFYSSLRDFAEDVARAVESIEHIAFRR